MPHSDLDRGCDDVVVREYKRRTQATPQTSGKHSLFTIGTAQHLHLGENWRQSMVLRTLLRDIQLAESTHRLRQRKLVPAERSRLDFGQAPIAVGERGCFHTHLLCHCQEKIAHVSLFVDGAVADGVVLGR